MVNGEQTAQSPGAPPQRGPGRPAGSRTKARSRNRGKVAPAATAVNTTETGTANRPEQIAQGTATGAGTVKTGTNTPRKRIRKRAGTANRPAALTTPVNAASSPGMIAGALLNAAPISFTGQSWNPALETWNTFERRQTQQFAAVLASYRNHLALAHAPLLTMTAGGGRN